jgi:hypothetical protein
VLGREPFRAPSVAGGDGDQAVPGRGGRRGDGLAGDAGRAEDAEDPAMPSSLRDFCRALPAVVAR